MSWCNPSETDGYRENRPAKLESTMESEYGKNGWLRYRPAYPKFQNLSIDSSKLSAKAEKADMQTEIETLNYRLSVIESMVPAWQQIEIYKQLQGHLAMVNQHLTEWAEKAYMPMDTKRELGYTGP